MRWWIVCGLVACSRSTEPDISKIGATELEYELTAPLDAGDVKRALDEARLPVYRAVLSPAGHLIVQIPYARLDPAKQKMALAAVQARFGAVIAKAAWAGNRLHLRGSSAPPEPALRESIASAGLEVIGVDVASEPALGETNVTATIAGPELVYERAIEARFPVKSPPVSVEFVGPSRR